MRRMRQRRAGLAVNDSAQRLTRLGIQVFFGDAAFIGAREVAVGSQTLRFTRAAIATGSRPAVPPIDGLADTPYLTNETVFELTERPDRLLVIGGGPIGCELSQAFARLGSRVTVFDQARRVLANDDPDAAVLVQRALTGDGVQFELGAAITRVSHRDGAIDRAISADRLMAREEQLAGDRLLVATGRAPNVEGLDLARAGIQAGPTGVVVDDRLRTSNRRVYAAGDVCSRFQFTHVADAIGAHRHSERVVFRTQESERADDSMVHLYGPGGRARRTVGRGRRNAKAGCADHLGASVRRRSSRPG